MKELIEQEVWVDVIDYEGLYMVSDLGRMKSFYFGKEIILKQYIDARGYYFLRLCKDNKCTNVRLHRIVWESFNGAIPKGMQIDHKKEGNKLDNRLCNLQAITSRQNITKHHLATNKTSKYIGVCWGKRDNAWHSRIMFNKKRIHLGYFKTEIEAAKAYIIALNTIKIYTQ